MSTITRPELSCSNRYYVNKHRYYELKHFCMQYPNWKKILSSSPDAEQYLRFVKVIEEACKETDPVIGKYILKAVTEGYSYDILRARSDVPCCRDSYYELYRRFFWVLDSLRD